MSRFVDRTSASAVKESPPVPALRRTPENEGTRLSRNDSSLSAPINYVTRPIDFTKPEANQFWKAAHDRLMDQGVASFKTDYGECVATGSVFHAGRTSGIMCVLRGMLSIGTLVVLRLLCRRPCGNMIAAAKNLWPELGSRSRYKPHRHPNLWKGNFLSAPLRHCGKTPVTL